MNAFVGHFSNGVAGKGQSVGTTLSTSSFLLATVALNVLVFFGSDIAAVHFGWYVAESLSTIGLLVQVALIQRRETAIMWQWPWRFGYALVIAGITYVFLSSVYVPSPAPFERDTLLRREQTILSHYVVFLLAIVPVVLSCVLTKSNNQPMSRRIVRRIL